MFKLIFIPVVVNAVAVETVVAAACAAVVVETVAAEFAAGSSSSIFTCSVLLFRYFIIWNSDPF